MNEPQHISKIIGPALLTAIKARSTKEKRLNTPELAKLLEFNLLDDPKLVSMVDATFDFIEDAEQQPLQPRWLSFCGNSGIGKTHLAVRAFNRLKVQFSWHSSLLCGSHQYTWPRLLPKLRDGAYWLVDDIRDANLLLLDDIGADKPTEFALEKLYEIIEARTRKWTIFTCNLSVAQIAERMDTRIASRLIRDGSVVLDVDAPDYNNR